MSTNDAPLTAVRPDAALELPFVSVVVPTRDRAACVRELLDALVAQSYPAARREVIVVDNDSTEDVEGVVTAAAVRSDCDVRFVHKRDDGPAASRNLGAALARGEILAYTDSDCIPDRDWLQNGVRAFAERGVGIVCGPIAPLPLTDGDPFFVHQVLPVMREEGLYPTANVLYRRDAFLELGGFDETFRTYPWGQPVGGDDTEFAWRMKRAGYRSAFVAGARVSHRASGIKPHHYVLNSLQAQILPRMVRSSPELRRAALYRRYFVHKGSMLFLVAAGGTLLARRKRTTALLALPWLASLWPILRADAWPPKRWPRAGARLALHIVSAVMLEGALVYGSIKNRRLVL